MKNHLFNSQPDTPSSPGRDSPAQRLAEHSAKYLSDVELLSLLIKGSSRNGESLQKAREILNAYGSLTSVSQLTLDELKQMGGIGTASASAIHSAFALASRLSREKHSEKVALESPQEVADFMREEYRGMGQETFYLLLLNTKHRLIRREIITTGLVDRSQIHAREVFRSAISANSSRVIVTHNHPSGEPDPSDADRRITQRLKEALGLIEVRVLDHIVVGGSDSVSFAERGYL